MARPPVAAGESKQEYLQLLGMIAQSYEPCSAYELYLVTRMAALHWRLLRLERHETDKLTRLAALRVAKISVKRDMGAVASRYLPRGIGQDELNTVKLEVSLYRLLEKLQKEFAVSQARRKLAALQQNSLEYALSQKPEHVLGANESDDTLYIELANSPESAE